MSNLMQSYAKRGVSTSHAWHWPKRLFFGLAMVLLLPVSQNVAAIPFCGVELKLTLVDFSYCGGRDGSIDVLNDTAQLRTHANTLGAEYSSNADLCCRLTLQLPDPAQSILSGILAVRRKQSARNVNDGQVGDHQQEPVALTMTIYKIGAPKTNGCMHTCESHMHRAKWRAIDVGQFEYNRER